MTANTALDPQALQRAEAWLAGPYDEETKAAIRRMVSDDAPALNDAFYTTLSFGTGGMRGIMGPGTNRFNIYTVRAATQGLANYLVQQPLLATTERHHVIIGYDSRHNSRRFAEEAAKVLAANGIAVFLCRELRPTPYVSFGCRALRCKSAIVITASHNPPVYNGYKVYWDDGAQVLPPHDKAIVAQVNAITSPEQVHLAADLTHPLISEVGAELDERYLDAVAALASLPEQNHQEGRRLKVVYTALHGTGITLAPAALRRWGFGDITLVAEQCRPDGAFPTVASPNPEEPAALRRGIALLEQCHGDLLLATDPDADRVGVAVRHHGAVQLLDGNQVAVLCLWHVLEERARQGTLPPNAAVIKTLPTSELFKVIAEDYGVACFDVLTGFKYIAELITQWEHDGSHHYLFGGEESYGYLLGTYARDKDAISSCALLCEAALQAKLRGETLVDVLHGLWRRYGVWQERLLSLSFDDGKEGRRQMSESMERLRSRPPLQLAGKKVEAVEDYLAGQCRHQPDGAVSALTLPRSDVLLFRLEGGDKAIVRPSGTEPKVKLYACWHEAAGQPLDVGQRRAADGAAAILQELRGIIQGC